MRQSDRKKRLKKKYESDDLLENVSSFEEAREIIRSRLRHLRYDLSNYSTVEDSLSADICKAHEEKKMSVMDMYAALYSPCKVSDPAFAPKSEGDMNDVMLDFSEGFDRFVESMEEEYVEMIMKRRRAVILLSKMLSFGFPYSRILYLCYYKAEDPKTISDQLYISRATFYRLKSTAVDALTELYYKREDNAKQESL